MIEPLDEAVDHVRGPAAARLIVEYGDYECPYSRQAFREIERVEAQLGEGVRFAFRHFPLTEIHPHALAASLAAEAAALQDRFWEMHELLFHRQQALADDDLRRYAGELGLDLARFDVDRSGLAVLERVRRDVRSGEASGEVLGTPTLFIDGVGAPAATSPRPPCWRRWRDERSLHARRRHTIGREHLKMATWIFEPGHTEAEFRARHMMVSWVRGLFKDIHGRLELDWDRCLEATFEGEIDAAGIWTGQPQRDEHLRSADFFDVENHPKITFAGRFTERTGGTTFKGEVELTIRGVDANRPARHRLAGGVEDAVLGR